MTRNIIIPALVAAGLFAGFAREVVLAFLFGTSREVEIFRVAFGLPSIFSDSLAVSFVAILIRILLDPEERRPAQALRRGVWATLIFAFVIFFLGVFTMSWQAQLLVPGMGSEDQARLLTAGRICWLMCLFVTLSFPMRAVMSTRGKVWPGAGSQLMRSGGFVVFLLAFVFLLGWRDLMASVAAAALGGVTVLVIHVKALGRRDRRRLLFSLSKVPNHNELVPVLSALGLLLLSQLFLSAGRILDRAVASEMGEGMLAGLEYSYALLMAFGAVLATSTTLLLAPDMALTIRETGRLARRHAVQIFIITVLGLVVGFGLALGAESITRVVYQRGAFDIHATMLTAQIFKVHALGLGPLVLALLLTQVLLLHGLNYAVLYSAGFKMFVKTGALWWVVEGNGDIVSVGRTLLWTELAMSILLLLVVLQISHREVVKQAKNPARSNS